jgi:Xaa-Pro aminopeptidase
MLLPRTLLRTHATAAARVAKFPPKPAPRALHLSAALRAIDMSKVDTTERLAKLRQLMKERNVDIYSNKPLQAPTL